MQTESYPEVPPDFGNWLAGFIDGEGCFTINRAGGNTRTAAGGSIRTRSYSCRLSILLRDDDRPMLEEIVRVTGIGYVQKRPRIIRGSQPGATWRVDSKADCFALIRLLDHHPLRAKKARDYAVWRDATYEWGKIKRWGGNQYARRVPGDWSKIIELAATLKQLRVYQSPSVLVLKPGVDDPIPACRDEALF